MHDTELLLGKRRNDASAHETLHKIPNAFFAGPRRELGRTTARLDRYIQYYTLCKYQLMAVIVSFLARNPCLSLSMEEQQQQQCCSFLDPSFRPIPAENCSPP